MDFMPSIRSTTILLLLSCSAAPIAGASEPTEPPPASEGEGTERASEAPSADEWIDEDPVFIEVAEDPIPLLIHLYQAGDMQGLRTEALVHGFDAEHAPQLAAEIQYMGALASLGLGEERRAHAQLRSLSEQTAPAEVRAMSQLVLASAWMEWAPQETARLSQAWLAEHPEGPHREVAAHQAAFGYAAAGRFSTALSVLDEQELAISDELRATLLAPPRWKRPALAAALSGALPGAGQLYAGHPKEALSAFTLNALFIGGAALAARQQSWPTLGVLGFFGLGFYFGNIYGAADGAIRTNRDRRDQILYSMEGELGPQGAPPLPSR